jgi:DNA-binding NarL/FixJ family response regulator
VIGLHEWIDADQADDHRITRRQRDILAGIAKGWTNAEIGRALFLSEDTVNTHARGLFRRLQVSSRAAAVAVAYDVGVLRTRAMRVERARAAGLRVVA